MRSADAEYDQAVRRMKAEQVRDDREDAVGGADLHPAARAVMILRMCVM
jgi:hypothetical protein